MKLAAGVLAMPAIPAAVKYAFEELLEGKAFAQAQLAAEPTYYIEINWRDQVDFGEVFVAPGLATDGNLIRGERGRQCALFYQPEQLMQFDNNFYLTPESMPLAPYLDSIAAFDTCELTPGAIHYHQAANRTRMPDCNYDQTAGRMPVYDNDPISNFPQGCEEFYATTPSPASFHNYIQKRLSPDLRNGIAIKGVSRTIHTVYHFGAGLPGAELDRMQTREALFNAFPATDVVLPTILPTEQDAALFVNVMKRIDPAYLQARGFSEALIAGQLDTVQASKSLLFSANTKRVTLPLTDAEDALWKEGVVSQIDGRVEGQDGQDEASIQFQIWEQYAWALKLLESGLTRTVALELEFVDIHDSRPRKQMQTHSTQLAPPLARLIQGLMDLGIYDRTLISVHTTDGSRSPAAGSAGNEGKNTVYLAGGMIKGGYYSDIRAVAPDADGHQYGFRSPDPATGTLLEEHTDNEGRLPGSAIWRTAMKALRIPDAEAAQFAGVADAQPMNWVLKS
jgi:hypothetical protein